MSTSVYQNYDQEQLDAQYDLRARHPDFQVYFDWYDTKSAEVRRQLECRCDVPYGETSLDRLDVFPALLPGAPVHVFIHGGYWQFLDKASFSYPALPLVQAGAAFVSVNYPLIPEVTLDEIVSRCRTALTWCFRNATSFNADPGRLYLSGHSAGAHLAMMLLATHWRDWDDLPDVLVKGVCPISGLYDLEPIRLSYETMF